MSIQVAQTIYTVAEELILQLSISDDQLVVEDSAAEVDVNGCEAAGFTLIYNGVRYNINVTEQTEVPEDDDDVPTEPPRSPDYELDRPDA